MRKLLLVLSVLWLLVAILGGRLNAQNLVVNGGFENPVLSSYGNLYFENNYNNGEPGWTAPTINGQYPPSTDWQYSYNGFGNNAGLSTTFGGFEVSNPNDPGNPYDPANPPDGNQFCFITQGGNYVSQQIVFPTSGVYELSYYAAGRLSATPSAFGGDTSYGLYLDSTLLADGTTTTNSPWTKYGPIDFSVPAGTETLTIGVTGIPPNDIFEQSACFDDVSIKVVPEPSTVALLATSAIAILGFVWRKAKKRLGGEAADGSH